MRKILFLFLLFSLATSAQKKNVSGTQERTFQKYKSIENKILEKLEEEKKFSVILFSGMLLFLGISIFLGWSLLQTRKEKRKLLSENLPFTASEVPETNIEKESVSLPKNLNKNIEKEILKKLYEFENSKKFLLSNITAGSLAAHFNTNVVYLAIVIKNSKKASFSNYINTLRIDYIISKLKSDPEYSTYKIAYLAEQSGFSSHGAFIRAFVKIKGIQPSKFINSLEKSNKKV